MSYQVELYPLLIFTDNYGKFQQSKGGNIT